MNKVLLGLRIRSWLLIGVFIALAGLLLVEANQLTPAAQKDPEAAAAEYARTLAGVLETPQGGLPRFDLVLLGMGLDGLAYQMTVLIRATVIDFADDLLEASRYPRVRGSLRCVECGHFAGRRAVGYGQLYCTDRCKKRAAKRRSRARSKDRTDGDVGRSAA